MEEFKGYILGELSIPYYLAAFVFSSLAIIVSLLLHARKRNPNSARTPEKFSFSFLIWDNLIRVMVTLILMFFFFRFSPRLFGGQLSMEIAVAVGFFLSFGLDKALQWIQQRFDVLKMAK
jgi:hypothetical protein